MTGEVHLIEHTSKTMSTRRMTTDKSKKSEQEREVPEHNKNGNGKNVERQNRKYGRKNSG